MVELQDPIDRIVGVERVLGRVAVPEAIAEFDGSSALEVIDGRDTPAAEDGSRGHSSRMVPGVVNKKTSSGLAWRMSFPTRYARTSGSGSASPRWNCSRERSQSQRKYGLPRLSVRRSCGVKLNTR